MSRRNLRSTSDWRCDSVLPASDSHSGALEKNLETRAMIPFGPDHDEEPLRKLAGNPDRFLLLQTPELATVLLRRIRSMSQSDFESSMSDTGVLNGIFPETHLYFPQEKRDLYRYDELLSRATQCVQWMRQKEWLQPDPGQLPEFFVIAKKGYEILEKIDADPLFKGIENADLLNPASLAPEIREKPVRDFVTGHYSSALGEAGDILEQVLRDRCGLGADVISRKLISRALAPVNNKPPGLLTDRSLSLLEQGAIHDYAQATYKLYRHPSSHGKPEIEPATSVQGLMAFTEIFDRIRAK